MNSTVDNLVPSAGTVQTVHVKNVMPEANSFWVLYGQHTEPTYLEDAGNGQQLQRDAALEYVKQWRVCLDIGSNIGQWTRPLARRFESVVCFEPNPNFRECFNKNIYENNVVIFHQCCFLPILVLFYDLLHSHLRQNMHHNVTYYPTVLNLSHL